MYVAYSTGTVTGFAGTTGLLKALTDWVAAAGGTGRDWTLELDQNAMNSDGLTESRGSSTREVILSNDGISGTEEIFVGIREYYYESTNEYNWELNGYLAIPPGWNSHAAATHKLDDWNGTKFHWTDLPILQCFDQEMEYWFYSSSDFIVVSIRVGTSYYECYLGNGQRLGPPSTYPWPLVVAGSNVGEVSYQAGGYGPARPKTNDTTPTAGEATCFFVDAAGNFNTAPIVEPMQGNSQSHTCADAPSGAAFMCPIFFRDTDASYLQLYNMFVPRTNNMLSEITESDAAGRTFRLFAQGQTDYDYDFLAILEDVGTSTSTTSTTTS